MRSLLLTADSADLWRGGGVCGGVLNEISPEISEPEGMLPEQEC